MCLYGYLMHSAAVIEVSNTSPADMMSSIGDGPADNRGE